MQPLEETRRQGRFKAKIFDRGHNKATYFKRTTEQRARTIHSTRLGKQLLHKLQKAGEEMKQVKPSKHGFGATSAPRAVCAQLNLAFGSYDAHVVHIPDGEFNWSQEELKRLWKEHNIQGFKRKKFKQKEARKLTWKHTSRYQLVTPWYVERQENHATIKARVKCLDNKEEFVINADMLVNPKLWKYKGAAQPQAHVEFGTSLVDDEKRRALLPSWHDVFSETDDRAHQKMRQADERAETLVDLVHCTSSGYILLLGGFLSETVYKLVQDQDIDPHRLIVCERDVQQLVHHEATRWLLNLPYHVLKCDLDDLLGIGSCEERCKKIAPTLPSDFLKQVSVFYADFCGAIHPHLDEWIQHLPNLQVLGVTQAHRLREDARREFPDYFGPLYGNKTFRCREVECRIYSVL